MGVTQNHSVSTTKVNCDVSRRKTCRLATIQPKPTLKSPSSNMYTGSSMGQAERPWPQMATAMRAKANVIR